MKLTLLQLTQDILYSMDGDEVTSINDTYESTQVTHILRTVFYDIVNRSGLQETKSPLQLSSPHDTTTPLLMTVPDTVRSIDWIKYDYATTADTDEQYTEVFFKPFTEFLADSHALDKSATEVSLMTLTTDYGDIDILYRNDMAPGYYTTYDDTNILFDSIDEVTDTGLYLDDTKTLAYGTIIPTFTLSDGFIPPLDDDQFPLLLAEAKSVAWAEMKQASNVKAEQSAKRNWITQQNQKNAIDKRPAIDRLPNYGRK